MKWDGDRTRRWSDRDSRLDSFDSNLNYLQFNRYFCFSIRFLFLFFLWATFLCATLNIKYVCIIINIYHSVSRREKAESVDYFHYIIAHSMASDTPYP